MCLRINLRQSFYPPFHVLFIVVLEILRCRVRLLILNSCGGTYLYRLALNAARHACVKEREDPEADSHDTVVCNSDIL